MSEILTKFATNLLNNFSNLLFVLLVATFVLIYVRIRLIIECRNILQEVVKSTVQNKNLLNAVNNDSYSSLPVPLLIDNAKFLDTLLLKAKVLPFNRNDHCNIFHLRNHLERYAEIQKSFADSTCSKSLKLLQTHTNLIFYYSTILSMYNPCGIRHLNNVGRVSPEVMNAWVDTKLTELCKKY